MKRLLSAIFLIILTPFAFALPSGPDPNIGFPAEELFPAKRINIITEANQGMYVLSHPTSAVYADITSLPAKMAEDLGGDLLPATIPVTMVNTVVNDERRIAYYLWDEELRATATKRYGTALGAPASTRAEHKSTS
jgi:hypothetical protein